MKLQEASIRLMEKGDGHGRSFAKANKKFDHEADVPLIELTHTRGNMSNHTWPDMTIADAIELRDALTILIDQRDDEL